MSLNVDVFFSRMLMNEREKFLEKGKKPYFPKKRWDETLIGGL